eukprot:1117547-Rhodomonas_salina.1
MALSLEFRLGKYLPLVNRAVDDGDDPVFQYIVVALAIEHGGRQSLPEPDNPLLDADHCAKNYQYIIQTIAGFSAQISSKCYNVFPQIFANQSAVAEMHQLAGLREFANIHCNYQRDGATINPSSAWQKNFAAIQRQLKPDTHTISEWITGIEKTVQGLALAKVPSDAIDGAVCCNVIDCLGSFTNAADPTAARWLQLADAMRMRNDIRGYAWSELFNAIQSHLAADALKEERTDGAVSSNTTPSKRKAVESDGAAVFYTLAQVQAAYLLGQQNTGGPSKSFTPGQPKGGEKALLINTDPNATCPKCKIHHQGGLHTCPSYQESKQILKTKYANSKFQSKKNKGAKQPDKTPEQQLPSMD